MRWTVLAFALMACNGSKDDVTTDSATDSAAIDYAAMCTASGGTVAEQSCCLVASDWGVTGCDGDGACGCAADNSHSVQVCECPSGTCYDPATGECS